MTLQERLDAAMTRIGTEFKSVRAALSNRVRVDAAQALTAPQQAQARSNIDADPAGITLTQAQYDALGSGRPASQTYYIVG